MNKLIKCILVVAACVYLNGCYLVSAGMHEQEGYADLSFPHFRYTDNTVNIAVGPNLLNLVKDEAMNEFEEYSELVKGTEAVRIRLFDATVGRKYLESSIDKSIENISDDNWETVVSFKEKGQRLAVLIKSDVETIYGVSVLFIDETQAAFVNLIGEFVLEDIQRWSERAYRH